MRILVVGDPHGGSKNLIPKIRFAGQRGIQKIVVVGDFGLWTHKFDGQQYLDSINTEAAANNLSIFAIGGNHENWDHWEWYVENNPTSKGFAYVRSRVLLAPKVHEWVWAGKQFVGAGGAVSVDKDYYRLPMEQGRYVDEYGHRHKATGPRTLYWPNEQLEDTDVLAIEQSGIKADYLFTHDCSNHTEFGKRLKPDADSENHRRRIDRVIAAVKPGKHFHGHMHEKYDWLNARSHGYYSPEDEGARVTHTLGLECNSDANSWGILDAQQDRWYWPNDVLENDKRREAAKAARYEASPHKNELVFSNGSN